ncbi:hypothetical protein [Thermoflexus sp.]|uniref:hypothetical protein n=1 Tax=Thermoflexus sp. TaxID=1969742 RepID=UPI0035E42A19
MEERHNALNLTLVERLYEYRPKAYPFLHPVRLEIVPGEGRVGVTGVVVCRCRGCGSRWGCGRPKA